MSPRGKIVACWGELVVDVMAGGAYVGGTAANVARNLAALGVGARLVSAVGDDALGDAALARLSALGVDLGGVVRVAEAATARVDVDVGGSEPRYHRAEELPWHALDFSASLETALAGADAVVFALDAQTCKLPLELLASVRRPRLRVADFNLRRETARAALERAAELTDVIQLGAPAAARVRRAFGTNDAARALFALGVDLVIETDGANGARVVSAAGELRGAPSRKAHASRGVGAGDAFIAAVTRALLDDAPLDGVLARALEHALAAIEGSDSRLALDVRE